MLEQFWKESEKGAYHTQSNWKPRYIDSSLHRKLSRFILKVHESDFFATPHQFIDLYLSPLLPDYLTDSHSDDLSESAKWYCTIHSHRFGKGGKMTMADPTTKIKHIDEYASSNRTLANYLKDIDKLNHALNAHDSMMKSISSKFNHGYHEDSHVLEFQKLYREVDGTTYNQAEQIMHWEYFKHFVSSTFLCTLDKDNRERYALNSNGIIKTFHALLNEVCTTEIGNHRDVSEFVSFIDSFIEEFGIEKSKFASFYKNESKSWNAFKYAYKRTPGLDHSLACLILKNYQNIPFDGVRLLLDRSANLYPAWLSSLSGSDKPSVSFPQLELLKGLFCKKYEKVNYYAYSAYSDAYKTQIWNTFYRACPYMEKHKVGLYSLIQCPIKLTPDAPKPIGFLRLMNKCPDTNDELYSERWLRDLEQEDLDKTIKLSEIISQKLAAEVIG